MSRLFSPNRTFWIYLSATLFLFWGQVLVTPIFVSMSIGTKTAYYFFLSLVFFICLIRSFDHIFIPKTYVFLAGLILSLGVSTLGSGNPFFGSVHLAFLMSSCLLSIVVCNHVKENEEGLYFLLDALAVLGGITSLFCFYQFFYYLYYGHTNTVLIAYLLPPGNARVSGFYGQPNLNSVLLLTAIVSFFSIKLSNCYRGFFAHRHQVFYLSFTCVSLAFFLTYSRSGLIALAFVVIAYLSKHKQEKGKLSCVFTLSSVLLLLYFLSIWLSPSGGESRGLIETGLSADARFVFWSSAWLMFLDNPFLGVGLHQFCLHLPTYALKAHDFLGFVEYGAMGYSVWAHNELLQLLAEGGLLTFLFLAFIAMQVFKEYKKLDSRSDLKHVYFLLIPFVIVSFFSWPFRHPALIIIFFMIFAVLFAQSDSFKLRNPLKVKTVLFFLTCVFAFGGAIIVKKEISFLGAYKDFKDNPVINSDIKSLFDDPYLSYKSIVKFSSYYLQNEVGDWDKDQVVVLKKYLSRITSLQGTHTQWYNLALIHNYLGEYQEAYQAAKRAVQMQPVFNMGWALLHQLNVEKASRVTGRPIESFYPDDVEHLREKYDSFLKRQ